MENNSSDTNDTAMGNQDYDTKSKKDEESNDVSLCSNSVLKQDNCDRSLNMNSSIYCWPSEMDRLFDENSGAANETIEGTCFNKFNISDLIIWCLKIF